jgi:HEAT repeat protein
MKQTNRAVRWHSADALGRMGPGAAEAVGDLIAILKDPNDYMYVRGRAAAALGGIGAVDGRVVPALIWALGNDDLQYHAVYALGLLGPAAKPAADAIRDIVARETDRWRKEAAEAVLKKIMAGPATRT